MRGNFLIFPFTIQNFCIFALPQNQKAKRQTYLEERRCFCLDTRAFFRCVSIITIKVETNLAFLGVGAGKRKKIA